jgi:hypothetical protein
VLTIPTTAATTRSAGNPIMSYRSELHGTDSSDNPLPTVAEIFQRAGTELNRAYRALSNAADCLRSDRRPVGSPLTNAQAACRSAMVTAIETAKAAINRAKAETNWRPVRRTQPAHSAGRSVRPHAGRSFAMSSTQHRQPRPAPPSAKTPSHSGQG